MSDVKDPFEAAVDDLRALMTSFLDGDWTETHVIDARGEIFIARKGGGPNPLLGEIADSYDAPEDAIDVPAAGALRDLVAPHVATLVSIVARGVQVTAGAELARLSVLDKEEAFLAPSDGKVAEVCAAPGALVEHGTILIRLRESGE